MLCGLGAVPTNFNIGGDIFINEWLDFDAFQTVLMWRVNLNFVIKNRLNINHWTLQEIIRNALFKWWCWMSLIMPLCFWMINMNIIDCSPCEHWSIQTISSTFLWTLLSVFTISPSVKVIQKKQYHLPSCYDFIVISFVVLWLFLNIFLVVPAQ